MKLRVFGVLAIIVSQLGAQSAFAVERNEAAASSFLYCSYVNQFWYEYLSKHDPANSGLNGYKQAKDMFLLAAAASSDGDFINANKDATVKRIYAVLDEENKKKVNLMSGESEKCLKIFQEQAVPVLKTASGK